jgi:CRISPR/Cas system CSM-associated protein Csm3 (group 7 of RAMP superfamily)
MNATTTVIGTLSIDTLAPLSFSHHGHEGLPMMARGVDAEGRHQRTVFIPGAQVRGRIRHEAAMAEMRRSGQVKLEQAYLLALGQDLNPVEDDNEELVRLGALQAYRADKPIIDLFGTWKVTSRLQIANLLPSVNVAPQTLAFVRRDLDTNEDAMELLSEAEQDRLYERQAQQSDASKAESLIKIATRELLAAKKAKNDAKVDEMETEIARLRDLKAKTKGEDESSNTKHLVEVQVVPAGLTLAGRVVIQRARPRDLSILCDAMDGISRRPVFGAHSARGMGEVEGTLTLTTTDGEVLVVASFGGYKPARVQWTDAGTAFKDQPERKAA